MFFGSLDLSSPQLDHARFSAKISDTVFESRNTRSSNDSSYDNLRPLPRLRLSHDLASFEAIIKLARTFTEEVLTCIPGGCTICHVKKAEFLVIRPLSATRNGFFELPDFEHTARLMSIIASHTTHITQRREVDWSIGNIADEKPYVCTLAVPVCVQDAECSRAATNKIQAYIDAILEGSVKANPPAAKFNCSEQSISATAQSRSFSSSRDDGAPQSDCFGELSRVESSVAASESDGGKLYPVGMTVFVGRPSLQIDDPPNRGQLSCLVFSSSWPKSLLPGAPKNEADDAIDYCRIVASHEVPILESADYRCAVCSKVVPAGSLLHCPLAFTRTHATNPLDESLRQLVMKLFQYVRGRWNFSAVNSALGSESDAHIFDYVVPICRGKSTCEEVARAAAQEFINLLLPPDMRLIFPGLDPDTDLKVYEELFEDEFDWVHEAPRLLVCKPSLDGFMTDASEGSERSMEVPNLRQWYVDRFGEPRKRKHTRESEEKQSTEYSDSEDDAASEIDESMVWVYVRSDLQDETSQRSTEAERRPRLTGFAKRAERQMLFEPMMSFDFWLVNEAIGRGCRDDTTEYSSSTGDEDVSDGSGYEDEEVSSECSGDTEILRSST